MLKNSDWLFNLLREMIETKATLINLGKMQIQREKSSLTQFNFGISINKSVFEDLLTEEEKALTYLEKVE